MSDKRIAVITSDGKFGTIGEEFAQEVTRSGGRVLTAKETESAEADAKQKAADDAQQTKYDQLSTGQKVLGVAGEVARYARALYPHAALAADLAGTTAYAPPEVHAFEQGAENGLSAGLVHGAIRQGIDATLGHDAGDKYAAELEQRRAASPYAFGAGQVAGTTAGLATGPGAAAESLAARGLARAGVTGASVLGRAGIAATKLGIRGAVEGGITAGGEYAGEQLLQDKDLAVDKLFAATGTGALYGGGTGAVLGGAGSLLASGAKGFTEMLAKRGEQAATAAEGARALGGEAPASGVKKLSNEMAVDALGATKKQITNALEHVSPDLATSRQALGDYMNRQILPGIAGESGTVAGAAKVGLGGRADQLLPLIQADMSNRIGPGLSESVKGVPARVSMHDIAQLHIDIYRGMTKDPAAIAGAQPFFGRVEQEMQALYNAGKVAPDHTIGAADLFYVRSNLATQAYELGRASGSAGDAYKGFLRKMDRLTVDAIDRSAAAAGKSGVGDQIRYWKREWQLASAAEEMATGGAERITGNNAIGIREGIGGATAIMTGHPILGVVGPLALKTLKERGKAVAAYALGQIADRGALAKLVARQDAQIGSAAKGLLMPPPKGALEAHLMPNAKAVAKTALARVAAFQTDPEKLVDHSTRDVEGLATHSPDIAQAIVQRHVQAMTFLSSKVPQQADPDPLDPHAAPRMTTSEQATFARYAFYVDKPERFFQEVARGKLTPEGAETAQALMPRAFEQLQAQTAEALALQLTRGNRLPFRQREILGQLLDFPATPSQRPGHAAFLQQNLADVLPSNDLSSAAPAKSRRSSITPSGSSLDRLEAGGPGHR